MTSTNSIAIAPRRKTRKPAWFKARALTACCGLALVLGSPAMARADSQDDDADARLGGYGDTVKLEKSGVAVSFMLFVVLSVIGSAAMCKNANRSHLD